MIGSTISHYRVLSPLGTGGMSVVYLAEDLRLGRHVAIKLLPPELEHYPAALERLRREARLTSALNHPHICTIHDIGEHEGRTFLVMERLEGTTLKRIIDRGGALPLDRALRIGAEIADALHAAHAQGIVHRDVKPGNVFITPRGDAKVTDFGLAKQVPLTVGSEESTISPGLAYDVTLTGPGEALGTIAYMSPEQARGEAVDARSDLFSLGAVLYEMVTGVRAFPGSAPAVVFDAILNRALVSPQILVPDLPDDVVDTLSRLLAKSPADRYQSADALRDDLIAARASVVHSGSGSGSAAARTLADSGRGSAPDTFPRDPGKEPRRATGRWERGALWLVASSVVVAFVLTAVWLAVRPPATKLTERDSLLLADFANATGDPVFDGTLREALAANLDQSPFLDLVATERLNETLRLMGREPGGAVAHGVAREACERLNVKAMIEGAIRRIGQNFVVTLTATGCATGDTLAIEQAEVGRKEDVLKGLGRAARDLRARLGESLATIESFDVPIEQATTPSLDALKAYTLGQARRAQGAELESVPFFERAVEIDPHFATAWNALSFVYGSLGESAKGAEYGARAYAERERVSERERLAISYQYHERVTGELTEAIAALELWKRLYPRDYRPANSLSVAFSRTGAYEQAADEAREAIRRNPSRGFPYSNLAYALRGQNRFDEARAAALNAVGRGIETLPTRRLLYQLAVVRGDEADAAAHVAWSAGRPRGFDLVGAQAQVAAYQGRWRQARELYRQTLEMARAARLTEIASAYEVQAAWTAALLGYRDEAVRSARPMLEAATPQVRLQAVAVLAEAGDVRGLGPAIEASVPRTSRDTLLVNVSAPVARAAWLVAAGRPLEAVDALRPTSEYELGRIAALAPIHVRARALLAAGDGRAAAGQFRQLLEHRGVEPFSSFHAVATLGLARALALSGNIDESRTHYEEFLGSMAQADPELPIVSSARTELARLVATN